MAFVNDTVLFANRALNRLEALSGQARSYYSNPTMLRARALAGSLATSAATKGAAIARNPYVAGGAIAGAVGGAGYNYATDRRANVRSMAGAGLRGAMLGGLAGDGYAGIRSLGGPRAAMSAARSKMSSYGAGIRKGWGGMVSKAQAGGYRY